VRALLKENEQTALRVLKDGLSSRYKLLDFRLYGSKARGDGDDESDIDIMIKLETFTADIRMEIYHLAFDASLEYECLISPVIFTAREIEEGPLSESPLYKMIMREGIEL
jgi:uncharacterized protein